jgi:hypothetical protein
MIDFTPYVAWYAAAVATVVLGWDIAKWLSARPRFRVTARGPVCYADGAVLSTRTMPNGGTSQELADYCQVEIVNVGAQSSTLIEIEATHRVSGTPGKVFASSAAFELRSRKQLPAKLDPGEVWSARIDMRKLKAIIDRGKPVISIRTSHRARPILTPIAIREKS